MKTAKKTTLRSLAQFARAKRREGCVVCALPSEVRDQLIEASAKKIQRPLQLEWLRAECGVKVTDAQLTQHYSGRHDVEE